MMTPDASKCVLDSYGHGLKLGCPVILRLKGKKRPQTLLVKEVHPTSVRSTARPK